MVSGTHFAILALPKLSIYQRKTKNPNIISHISSPMVASRKASGFVSIFSQKGKKAITRLRSEV